MWRGCGRLIARRPSGVGARVQPPGCAAARPNERVASFFFSSRRRHTRCSRDWSSDVCSSDLRGPLALVLVAPSALNLETGSQAALDRATSGRADLVGGGLRMVRDRPLYGFGSGAYAERYREREKVSSEKVAAASHTIPLTVTAEQGVIGLAAYVVLVALSFALLFDRLRSVLAGAPWPGVAAVTRAGLAAAYAALILHTLVYAAYLEDPLSWALLAVAAGLRARPPGIDGEGGGERRGELAIAGRP